VRQEAGLAGEIRIGFRREFMKAFFDLNEGQIPFLSASVFLDGTLASLLIRID
jgi:hypothetical protein